jgi:DMSO reductase family type II enzyme heme b subunit
MKKQIDLVAAPVGLQPGGYVPKAYADRANPKTASATLEVARLPGIWRVAVSWECAAPVREVGDDPSLFPDAAALLVPQVEGAPWITMGAPGRGVEGLLWRADRKPVYSVHAEGLGTVKRDEPPAGWSAKPDWRNGSWRVDFTLRGWPALDAAQQLAFAIWRGSERERGGLKSVTPGWIGVAT